MTTNNKPAYEAPTHLTLPIPQPLDYQQAKRFGSEGIVKYGHSMLVRITREQHTIVQEEAARLGVPVAAFIRWCAVAMAKALREDRTNEKPNVEL